MKFYVTLTIAVLGVGLVAGIVSAQDEINYTEMVEDLKVMCRIVDKTMDETFENDYVKGGFFRRGGCQHLYLKGYGPVFLLDVQFPVAEKEMKIVKTEKKMDLWEKHEREVRYQYRPEGGTWVVGNDESYSKEKVDKLKKQLAYLVGEYGSRIGQLALDDTISFVVFGHSDYTADLGTDFLDLVWRVEHVGADATAHPRKTTAELREQIQALRKVGQKLEEAEQKLEEKAKKENQDNDKIEELREKIQTVRVAGQELEEAGQKLEGSAKKESQDNDKKVIGPRDETMKKIETKVIKIEDSELKDSPLFRLRIPVPPTPAAPPIPPSLTHRLRAKPATTLVLTFKRSQLEGKKGTDWEALLEAAEIVEY